MFAFLLFLTDKTSNLPNEVINSLPSVLQIFSPFDFSFGALQSQSFKFPGSQLY